jgi:hypothetical protein
MFWLVAVASAGPLHADKRMYDVALAADVSWLAEGFTQGGSLFARLGDHAVAEAGVSSRSQVWFEQDGGTSYRTPGVRFSAGGAWSIGATGLHGFLLGARVVAGRASYYWSASTTSCFQPTPNADTTCVFSGEDPDLPWRAPRIEVQPHLRAQWIGHPGLTLGAEFGLNVLATSAIAPGEPRVGPYGVVSLGWAVPIGEPPISSATARARLSPEDATRRRRQNRAVAIGVASATGATALFLGGALLAVVTGPGIMAPY